MNIDSSVTRLITDCAAVILAGGKSSRMGEDKRLVALGAEPLLTRSIRFIGSVFEDVYISSNDAADGLLEGHTVIPDRFKDRGPLGGIHAALQAIDSPHLFIIACDTPFPSRALIERLHSMVGNALVTLPESSKGLEPLFAFYSRDCLPLIQNELAEGRGQVISFLSSVSLNRLQPDEIALIPGAEAAFINVNRRSDLDVAAALLEKGWSFE